MAVDPLIFLCIPLAIAPSKGKHFFPKNCWQHVFLFFWSPSCNVQGIWGQRNNSRSLNIGALMRRFRGITPFSWSLLARSEPSDFQGFRAWVLVGGCPGDISKFPVFAGEGTPLPPTPSKTNGGNMLSGECSAEGPSCQAPLAGSLRG